VLVGVGDDHEECAPRAHELPEDTRARQHAHATGRQAVDRRNHRQAEHRGGVDGVAVNEAITPEVHVVLWPAEQDDHERRSEENDGEKSREATEPTRRRRCDERRHEKPGDGCDGKAACGVDPHQPTGECDQPVRQVGEAKVQLRQCVREPEGEVLVEEHVAVLGPELRIRHGVRAAHHDDRRQQRRHTQVAEEPVA